MSSTNLCWVADSTMCRKRYQSLENSLRTLKRRCRPSCDGMFSVASRAFCASAAPPSRAVYLMCRMASEIVLKSNALQCFGSVSRHSEIAPAPSNGR
jgi:hypothetical protein